MSSITNNLSNNASVVNVGRTTPVSPGAQSSDKSIPVVVANDQTAVPVAEQNKVQSEVALSLLGIPRAEVALGIFADVNTYDVNPSEWSSSPTYHIGTTDSTGEGSGIKHLPTEAGALVEAPRDKVSILTSKRFFRYQPGRVSAATFGVKSTISTKEGATAVEYAPNPTIKKFGIYDNYDGYFWETRNNGKGDNFSVVRRSQSLLNFPNTPFGVATTTLRGDAIDGSGPTTTVPVAQIDDYRTVGKGKPESDEYTSVVFAFSADRKILEDNKLSVINTANAALVAASASFYTGLETALGGASTAQELEAKCKRDACYWLEFMILDMKWGGTAHTRINATNYRTAVLPNPSIYEKEFYLQLKDKVVNNASLGLSSEGITKLTTLFDLLVGTGNTIASKTNTAITSSYDGGASGFFNINAVSIGDVGSRVNIPLTALTGTSGVYGNRNAIDTIFEVKSYYWAYYVSTKTQGNAVGGYINTNGTAPASVVYAPPLVATGDTLSAPFTAADLKYKCQRDVGYILDGIRNDLVGGGDAETSYNMSMYFKGTGMSIYSQATSTLSEIARYTHLKELVKNDLDGTAAGTGDSPGADAIFGYTDGANSGAIPGDKGVIDKIESLLDDVIANFSEENDRSPTVGKRGYAGNLVALRDGLIVTHAAVFDPSLLKDSDPIVTLQSDPEVIHYTSDNNFNADSIKSTSATNGTFQFADTFRVDLQVGDLITPSGTVPGTTGLTADTVYRVSAVTEFDSTSSTLADRAENNLATTFTLVKNSDNSAVTSTASTNFGQANLKLTINRHRFKLTRGHVTFGQTIKYTGTTMALGVTGTAALVKDSLYKVKRVYGPQGSEFTLQTADPSYAHAGSRTKVTHNGGASGATSGTFELAVPFIFPRDYDPKVYKAAGNLMSSEIRKVGADSSGFFPTAAGVGDPTSGSNGKVPAGPCFPYLYASSGNLSDAVGSGGNNANSHIGLINTASDLAVSASLDLMRQQIDDVNFYPEYINWIKNNVKPEFYGVYDYRVPRSRFSHDALDGIASTATSGTRNRVYSDLATAPDGTIARPGQNYVATVGGLVEKQNSEYEFDFTKVTMLKTEFSWYGAVGALFLAYVPVGNGEARWVRVHHMRASNQMKIASLGNATLPITYTTYGGGNNGVATSNYTAGTARTLTLGDGEAASDRGYASASHHIVKYGASYYIDGGDRGTVRLYSHNNDTGVSAYGRKFTGDGTLSDETTLVASTAAAGTNLSVTSESNDLIYPLKTASNEDLASLNTDKADLNRLTGDTVLPNSTSTTLTLKSGTTDGTIVTNNAISLDVGDVIEISGTITADDDAITTPALSGTISATKFKVSAINVGSAPDAVTEFKIVQLSGSAVVNASAAVSLAGLTITRFEPINPRFFMLSRLLTDNAVDQNIKVCWADDNRDLVFLSNDPTGNPTGLTADRSANVYGIETKKVILSTQEGNAVRNRVQVYPTKLSTSNTSPTGTTSPVRLRFRKTPKFQYNCETSGEFVIGKTDFSDYTVTSANVPLTTATNITITSVDAIAFVDPETNIVGFDTGAGSMPFETGQPVKYSNTSGTAPGGLTNNQKYYIRKLKTIATGAVAQSSITEASPGVFTVTAHEFETGTCLHYRKATDGAQALTTSAGALTDGQAVYLIDTGTDTFTIASSLANAKAGTALQVTNDGHDDQFFEIRDAVKLYDTEANALAGTTTGRQAIANVGSSHVGNLIGIHGSTDYIGDGKYVYGWFRGKVGADTVTVFGELYRTGANYSFTVLDNYSSAVTLIGGQRFLPDLNFNANGQRQPVTTVETSGYTEKEGLSSVTVAPKTIVPIPGTGTNVATIYLQPGTEQIDLNTYFDYNKEYLSYPLTDEADTLYFAVDSDTVASEIEKDSISLGVTWEEQ